MTAFLGRDLGPEQLDQLVAGDRACASLEMQVDQEGQMLLGPKTHGRAAGAHKLGGPEHLELSVSDHLRPHARAGYPRFTPISGFATTC